jgi:hypothetical protein
MITQANGDIEVSKQRVRRKVLVLWPLTRMERYTSAAYNSSTEKKISRQEG